MALTPKQERQVEALILQCAFGSLGLPLGPTIGEVNKFVIKWSKIGASQYQLQNIVDRFVSRGWFHVYEEKIGSRKRRRYDISDCGMLALMSMKSSINPSFKPLMENLSSNVIDVMNETMRTFLAQGGPNGR